MNKVYLRLRSTIHILVISVISVINPNFMLIYGIRMMNIYTGRA
jgi:hypothetical protein